MFSVALQVRLEAMRAAATYICQAEPETQMSLGSLMPQMLEVRICKIHKSCGTKSTNNPIYRH